jgi:diphosphoinositol-polyphosphate diphosphatase
MRVEEELEAWPEQNTRKRTWLTVPEAIKRCRYPWIKEALEKDFSHRYCIGSAVNKND